MKIFCSGIGGIGLSAYACHMYLLGHDVSGSDRTDSALIQDLRKQGIGVTLTQKADNITTDTDLLVYSEAIPESSPERTEAKQKGIRQISYFQALGELTTGKNLIAVCGTHGKSSTTAMAIEVLTAAGLDPSAVVGTKVPSLAGRNWRKGGGDLWIVEACEYRRSFLFLKPRIILLTNADGDHFDAFSNADDYRDAFVEFLSALPDDGLVIAHGSDPESQKIVSASGKRFVNADTQTLPILQIPGVHMQKNAQLVAVLAHHLEIDGALTVKALGEYRGTWRRMEVKGTKNDITIIDDYAHHPVEIKATLAAMKSAYPDRRIVAVFQPHTHDRTLKLWNEFAESFKDADEVVLTSVYDARPDKDSVSADEKQLAESIKNNSGKPCLYSEDIKKTEQILCSKILKTGDVAVIMGAGDITNIADRLLGIL